MELSCEQNYLFLKRDRKKPQKRQRESKTGSNNWGKGDLDSKILGKARRTCPFQALDKAKEAAFFMSPSFKGKFTLHYIYYM